MKLFAHQQKLLDRAPDRHALVWEVGTGKTIGALSLVVKKMQQTEEEVIIICPKGLVDKWKADIKAMDIEAFIISKEQFKIHHKTLPRFGCVLVDEAHYFFGTKSQLMKSLKWYLEHHSVPFRYFLTGTPYRSSPMDIYVMANLLGQKLSYWTFQSKFFYQIRMGARMVPMVRPNIEKDIATIVQSLGSIVKLEECIDMPPATYKEEYVGLTESQKQGIIELDDTTPIVRFTKIHQICGGSLKGDEYSPAKFFEAKKESQLIELCTDIDKTIVVCRYNYEIERLRDTLSRETGKDVRVITGEIDGSTRHEILTELSGKNKYILLVNAAISEGWQLQNCSHMIFYSYGFELKNKIQMEGRIRRIDVPRPVCYISLIVRDTIDQAIYESLKNKESFHIEIYIKQNTTR